MWVWKCHNLSLGLVTKARACKGAGQEGSPWVTSHAPGSVGECEETNPHTPKWTPILGIGIPMDFQIFKEKFQGSKFIRLKSSLYNWKAHEIQISKMGLHDPFGHLKHRLWPKERPGIKLAIWFLTTKSHKLTWFLYVQVVCDISFKFFGWRLQLYFKPHLNQRSVCKVMGPKNCESPNCGSFGTPT